MTTFATKPADSLIVERSVPGGICFTWSPPLSILAQTSRVFSATFYVVIWLAFTGAGVLLIANGGEPVSYLFMFLTWTCTTAYVGWFLPPLARPMQPESITLSESYFAYDPGTVSSILIRLGWNSMDLLKHRWIRRPFTIPRVKLDLRLTDEVWCGRGHRLLVQLDGKELELASYLTAAERAWLFAEIEEWRVASQ